MIKVVIVNGRPGCGKTSFERFCEKKRAFVTVLSTVDYVKKVAEYCGWDGNKDLKSRKLLSDLKKALADWDDVPFKKVKEVVDAAKDSKYPFYFFIDCREPEEIDRLKKAFHGFTLLIRRPNDETVETSNASDEKVFEYNYDLTILNNSDIITLEKKAEDFMNLLDENMEWTMKGE